MKIKIILLDDLLYTAVKEIIEDLQEADKETNFIGVGYPDLKEKIKIIEV